MAAFTFHSGNAAGLRRLPRYLLGALATLVVPRTARLWVFGCGIGPGEGALPLYRLARGQPAADVRLVWLATTDAELARARELGLDAVPKLSRRGFWLTLRASVLVVTHGLGDVNRYAARGGFVVQLWHGIPLKRLHLDAPAAQVANSRIGRIVVRRGYRVVGRQIDLFPVAAAPVADRIVTAFGVARENVVVTGDPRDDVLLAGTAAERRDRARRELSTALGPLPDGPVVLYAPTWRDGEPDPAAPDHTTWARIAAWLDTIDGTFVVRNHPLGNADYAAGPAGSPRVRLLDSTLLPDLTPVLPAVDHLVTDYSSVAYDFALIGGTAVFLAVDLETYADSRGLYEPYADFAGAYVTTWPEALARLDDLARGRDQVARLHADRLRDEHFDVRDARATERVLAEIGRRTGQFMLAVPPAPPVESVRPAVRDLRVTDTHLELTVELASGEPARPALVAELVGPRQTVAAELADGGPTRIPLLATRWGVPGLAVPSGDYRLRVGGVTRVDVPGELPPPSLHPLFRVQLLVRDRELLVRVSAPLTDDERDPSTQRALRTAALLPYRARENAVYFESFYGRSASDNPLAIDRVLARRRPDVTRYWSVTDRSVVVPDGAVPLVEYGREWWRVRREARVYVINDWLRWTHRRRRRQHVLQTWHGTMLKRLALDRPHSKREGFAAVRQSLRWNVMLAENDYSAEIFRSCYAFTGPIWTTGYPRNDVFADGSRAAGIRAAVGIPDGARAVLYAPTWRDDRAGLVDYLDLARFADRLPEGHVLLVRGHSRTLTEGGDLRGRRLLDVTSYPDVADLMLVADVLVTDYSSVMFDFAATGKPMIFYTPDRAHYGETVRGFYFDLLADAPGPVVDTGGELLAAIEDVERTVDKYAERYAAWRARFTPHDDGHAAERVVDRMLAAGWLD